MRLFYFILFVFVEIQCQNVRFSNGNWNWNSGNWGTNFQECRTPREECMNENICRSRGGFPLRTLECRAPSTEGRSYCCRIVRRTRVRPPPPASPSTTTTVASTLNVRRGNAAVSNCGVPLSRFQGQVVGGVEANQGDFPWMVAITLRDSRGQFEPHCTGFMIDSIHVLTAAHCFQISQDPGRFNARIGHVDLRLGESYSIQQIVLHEGYPVQARPPQFYDDIAIMTLTRRVNTSDFTPICLPHPQLASRNLTGRGTTVAGWGVTSPDSDVMSNVLRELSLMPVISNSRCNQIYRQAQGQRGFRSQFPRGISEGFLCAGYTDEALKDACGGDSGGPLMYQERNIWYAIGIVSFGYSCGEIGFAGGYTRVSQYLDWIQRNTS